VDPRDAEIASLRATLAAERARADRELDFARRIQLNLMPPVPQPPGWEIATWYRAARVVGGDFYDVYELPQRPGRFGLVVADVTGKGLTAALMMAFSRAVLRAAAYNGTGPADALERTNRVLVRDARTGLLVTVFLAVLDTARGRLRYASGGHEPALIARPRASGTFGVRELPSDGTILGLVDEAPAQDRSVVLVPGDVLVAYTDGITDALGQGGRRFGTERLAAVVSEAASGSASEVVEAVVAAVDAFAEGLDQADDLTLLAVRCRPSPGASQP
jgi:sigma-B regulation protein RsbU (phosphoserine phosphatase)